VTARQDWEGTVRAAVQLTLESPHINYLLVTLFRDVRALGVVHGSLAHELRGEPVQDSAPGGLDNRMLAAFLQAEFGLQPFATMGSNVDLEDPRWLSYLVATVRSSSGRLTIASLRASLFERGAVRLARLIRGRYPMYLPQHSASFRLQLLLNALTGGAVAPNLLMWWQSSARGADIRAKRLLIQNPAEIAADGRVVHCRHCPDAVLKNGHLVPVCISDCVQGNKPIHRCDEHAVES